MLRVLHGPINFGNQAWVLSRHERRLGIHSEVVVSSPGPFQYPADCCLGRSGRSLLGWVRRLLFGLSAPFRYDVLHLYFGRSYLGGGEKPGLGRRLAFAEVRLARRLGRKVFLTLQGCDARLSDESAARNEHTPCRLGQCATAPRCRQILDGWRRYLRDEIVPLADRVFALNPELLHYVPRATFLPYASVDVESLTPCWPRTDGVPVLLHAPSDESIKGSALIRSAIERLRQRRPLEYVEIRRLPHADALKQYRRADLVIDQVLTGWYGGVAVEAMAQGKPVACYLRSEDLHFVPPALRAELPLVRLTPSTLEDDLEQALLRQREWRLWGEQARAFALRWHHPGRIAQAMVQAYRDPAATFTPEALASRAA